MFNAQLKYVVFDTPYGEEIHTFPYRIQHKDYVHHISQLSHPYNSTRKLYEDEDVVVGAGFVKDGVCCGRSVSLNVSSRGEADTALLNQ